MGSLTGSRGQRLAEIAQSCGYYDQAHLNRGFRELAGISPSAFVASLLPDGIGVGAWSAVRFVQDPTPARP